jgi:hypothetical protein
MTQRTRSTASFVILTLAAGSLPACRASVRPTVDPRIAPVTELWESPRDIARSDLFFGPWGESHAPDPHSVFTFRATKETGSNPGMTVADESGHVWHVKQWRPVDKQGAEAPVEIALSRILSAIGYHQPPIYYLPDFTVHDPYGTYVVPGGRFRLSDKSIKETGHWSWQHNPFVGSEPYQGLLVILLMFDSSDLKNVNNALYEVKHPGDGPGQWYVVRDLGTALGVTGRVRPTRNNVDLFVRQPFITGVKDGFVEFTFHGWQKELYKQRITPAEVRWASALLAQLSDRQWSDAFRAGGFDPDVANRFIARIREKVAEGLKVGDSASGQQ